MRPWIRAPVLLILCAALGCEERQHARTADGLLLVEPSALDFQRQAIFTRTERPVHLRNGGPGRLNVLKAWVESEADIFSVAFPNDAAKHIDPGGESLLLVQFYPDSQGDKSATLAIQTDEPGAAVFRMPLSGTALNVQLVVTPNPLDFGRIEAGSQKDVAVTYENVSELPLVVNPHLKGADADEFSTEGFSLSPQEKRPAVIHFRPQRVGKKRALLSIAPCPDCPTIGVPLGAEGLEQAIVADPPELDFGALPIDRKETRMVTVKNISTEPRALTGFVLNPATDASFTATLGGLPLVLSGGQERTIEVRFSPGHMGLAQGLAQVLVESARHPTTDLQLRAFGGSSELCVSPPSFDFGNQPVGSKTAAVVTLRNCGSANEKPLHVTQLYLGGGNVGEDQFHLGPVTLPIALAAGEEATVKLYFEPNRAGGATTVLNVHSDAISAAHLLFPFGGVAVEHAPCQLAVHPPGLDFGTVLPGHGAVLGLKLINAGSDLCAVKNIQLTHDADGRFRMPGGTIDGLVMGPNDAFSFMVAFQPPLQSGSFEGELQVEVSNPTTPRVLVPLVGNSQQSCLFATPPFLDFGQDRPDCPPAPMTTRLENVCAAPISVSNISIGPGTTDGEFVLRAAPQTPLVLQAGASFPTQVGYAAQVAGLNISPLYFSVTGLARPLLVPLVGESSIRATQTDRFTQQDGHKVDVLFVVDNTASMVEEHPRLVNAIPAFINAAVAREVDFHISVTTTGLDPVSADCPGGALGGEAGRLFPVDGSWPRLITTQSTDLIYPLQQMVKVGECATVEQGFEAVRRALSPPLVDHLDDPRTSMPYDGNLGFLRDEAALTVVFVSDEDDHSPDPVDAYADFLRSVKGKNQPQRVTAFAIAPTDVACSTAGGVGTRYAQLVQGTGGTLMSVCQPDYAPLLLQVANRSFGPQAVFPLSRTPDVGSLEVSLDGKPVTSGWTYDGTSNAVRFAAPPASGANLSITYRRACGR